MEKKKENSIVQNAVLRVILNIFNVIIPIITGPYLARTLDVDLYGIYNQSLSFVGFLLPFAGFGIYNYGIREISRLKQDKEKLAKLFSILFCVGAVSSLLVLIFYFCYSFGIVEYQQRSIYFVMSLQIISIIFNVEYMNEAFENYKFIVYKTLFVRILNVVLILLCVRKPDDILIYAFIYSFLQFLNYGLSFVAVKFKVKFVQFSWQDVRRILKPLIVVFFLMNSSMLYTNLDRMVMSLTNKGIYVSYYTFSQVIINLFINVMSSIIIVTIARLSMYIGKSQIDEYKKLVQMSAGSFFMLGIPMCVGFFVLSDVIMFFYGGINYIDAGKTFAIFSFRMLIWMFEYVVANQILFVQGFEKQITSIYFIGGGLNVIVKIILVIVGCLDSETAIFTTAIVELLVVCVEVYTVRKRKILGLEGIVKKYFSYFTVSLLFVGITQVNRHIFSFTYDMKPDLFIFLGMTILECVIIYITALRVMKDNNYMYAEEMIFNKFKRVKSDKKYFN